MELIIFTILFLAFLTAAFLAWYFTRKSREKERLIMLEKGMELPQVSGQRSVGFEFPWLKTGIVLVALSFGLMTGIFLEGMGHYWGAPPIVMAFFGGIGMIIAHFVDKKKD